jgi:dihydrofolate synthase/folylpolyglutamate synthase
MSTKHRYQQCLQEMYSLRRFGIKLGLGTIKRLLKGLGNPHDQYRLIHVAGTNGKGSIASTLARILTLAGNRVGLYTSPHLVHFNERIRIDIRPIEDQTVVQAYEAVKRVPAGPREPTFFEFATAMALHVFSRRSVDWAVIETGMGGRLDATNIIRPQLSIITNIALEHREYLGHTIAAIAREKGGIIKAKVPVVTGVRQKKAVAVIKQIAAAKQAPLYRLSDAFRVRRNTDHSCTYYGLDHVWRNVALKMSGAHQVGNAALVMAACEVLEQQGVNIPATTVRSGIATHQWAGRLEVVRQSPLVILDGAHNLIAARALGKYLSGTVNDRHLTLVVGILDDKPYQGMLKALLPHCSRVIVTRPVIDRALAPEQLAAVARTILSHVKIIPNVADAVTYALDTTPPEDAVCIAGSLYVVGEAKAALENSQT